jgi:hypothetical protein
MRTVFEGAFMGAFWITIAGPSSQGFLIRRDRKAGQGASSQGKAPLARLPIEELDLSINITDAEQLWIEEVRASHDAFLKGKLEAVPGEEVRERARKRLQKLARARGPNTASPPSLAVRLRLTDKRFSPVARGSASRLEFGHFQADNSERL